MITKEQYQQRLNGLKAAIDQSLANHNSLLGRKAECEETLKHLETLEENQEQLEVTPEMKADASVSPTVQ